MISIIRHADCRLHPGSLVIMALFALILSGCFNNPDRQQGTTTQDANIIYHPQDSVIVTTLIRLAAEQGLQGKPLNEIVLTVAQEFLGTVYVGHTLERDGQEALVVNLRELDCTTYLENVVVLSRLIKQERRSFQDYTKELKQIRYREGVLDLYPSRLHYFSDWLYDNEKKGIVRDITKELGGEEFNKEIFFMTRNREKYMKLTNDEFVAAISKTEEEISSRELYYIPEVALEEIEDKIDDGDLIAITSVVDGIDIAHVAIAIHKNNRLHIIHASSSLKKVVISEDPLSVYLEKNRSQSGIMVGRLSPG